METVTDFILGGSKITADGDYSHGFKRCLLLGRKAMTNLDSISKSRHYFANQVPSSQSYGFSSSHIWMWELGYKESWVLKNWCFWTVVLEKTLKSPLDCKEIKPVNAKGNSPEYSLARLMLKLKLQYFATWCEGPAHWKSPWFWERLRAGSNGDYRGWNGWIASSI